MEFRVTVEQLQKMAQESVTCFDPQNQIYWQTLRDKINEFFGSELSRLQRIIERDRTMVAEKLTAARKTLNSYDWLIEGRGSYEWDDDRWHLEFKYACDAIEKELEPLKRIAGDMSDSPTSCEEVKLAREPLESSKGQE